ncbi:Gfo/Idh/MocA family protein [Cerasicoccus arenae]|uniref:Oxidoreductase n=1 Tax=Cerasicoccus arenae TaxID=424488 RepID=A0A8J3GCI5_9BACT|nr:Gfo/Idh/MocA family oxidoreductase [Cerasicoccus arenae]MBK1856667.1 Gfo/Idh/MocA family oxidoreductase [Cerasicoccus arenae]GHB98783.1 oxidoreductase [Cerasicoccus arenae]
MKEQSTVRLGIIGMGGMGVAHARNILEGKVPGMRLAAIADRVQERLQGYGDDVKNFSDAIEMMESGTVDAVLIATPHYSHTPLGIAALERGLHVMVEKPISVHKADCERLISAWKDRSIVFGAMFNQRGNPHYGKLRKMIQSRELGTIQRVNWIITDWYRTSAYYGSGEWRATWGGEGGGVLLNQCPHNLDLLQWLFGMPKKITALCQFGRFHDIEVEDAVTALLEYPDGATGVFITSTGEAPGVNRLEVAADRGRVVIENGVFKFERTEMPVSEHSRTATHSFKKPEHWEITIPMGEGSSGHVGILRNFAAAILHGEPLIAPAVEGIHSVELANAMLYSTFTQQPVELPLDSSAYEAALKARSKA